MWRRGSNKFGAQRTNGMASKLESAVYDLLCLRERAGEIKDIQMQSAVELTKAKIRCKIDFRCEDRETGNYIWVEAKGNRTDRWIIIEKLWKFYGPGKLEIYTGNFRRPNLTSEIYPNDGEN